MTEYVLPCPQVWEWAGGYVPMIFEVDNMKTVCERRMDEGLRVFKDNTIGTIRTIDAGGINE